MILAVLLLAAAAQAASLDGVGPVSAFGLQVEGAPLPVEDRAPPRAPAGERERGTVLFFNPDKGFGFIARDDGGPHIFVHISEVERAGISLNAGDRVEFEPGTDRRGKTSAVDLVPIQ